MKVALLYDLAGFLSRRPRVGLGALGLFVLPGVTGKLALPTRHDLPVVLSVALFQMALFLRCEFRVAATVAAGDLRCSSTTPLWVVPGAVLFLDERLTRAKLVGLACGLLGVAVLFNPFGLDWSNRDVVVGSSCLMVCRP